MSILANFAVLEGADGTGTTTQLRMLEQRWQSAGPRSALPHLNITAEPTDGEIGRLLRRGLSGELALRPETIALLFAADRAEHLYAPDGVAARCTRGELVVSDRYLPSSLVYQGLTCGNGLPERVNQDFPLPELLLFFDLDPKTADKRMESREKREIYEHLAFQERVRAAYQALLPSLASRGVRVVTLDASQSPEIVAEGVWKAVGEMPIIKAHAAR
jgi:dTMP kinase